MELSGMMVALIAIALVTTAGMALFGNVMSNYGVTAPSTINGANTSLMTSFDQSSKIIALSNTLGGNDTGIYAAIKTIPILGSFGAVVVAGVNMLTMMFQVPGMYTAMISDSFAMLGMPPYIGTLIMAAILIILTVTIISAIVNWRTN